MSTKAERLWDRYRYPDWLAVHSRVVGRIAEALVAGLRPGRQPLEAGPIILGAYLHDIGRSPLLAGDERDHNILSGLVLAAEGLEPCIELARRHAIYCVLDPALAPVQAWTYTVNGKGYKGTAASAPIVVNEGDKVQVTFVNGGSKAMHVDMAHSIDFHSAEVAPSKYYVDVAPGKKEVISFVAKHPGVFMYHCATQPILMHTGAGMMGMMVVKPKNLAPVDKELWVAQSEAYIGKPGGLADMDKLNAKKPDVVMFNGYANQYKASPITVKRGERIRLYVLNAGPSLWSAFHVIGTVFDRTTVEGVNGHDSQTISLAPSQGGWVDFTLDQVGNYPFVTHAFGDMTMGAAGILHTAGAPMPKAPAAAAPAASAAANADVNITLGDMWIKSTAPSFKAGKISFGIKNTGATGHGLAIVKAPAKLVNGMVDHHTLLAEGQVLSGGQSETVSATLKPGSYELICHVPGHYMAGQHIPFTVTS